MTKLEGHLAAATSHTGSALSVALDDPNLVSSAGLVPVLALAERCGLSGSAAESLTVPSVNAAVKVTAVVTGMVAGADSIDDLGRLRHGGMDRLFTGIRAPSTLGTFLRSFTLGHVKQLDKVAAQTLVNLAGHSPLLRDVDRLCWVDVDDAALQHSTRQNQRPTERHRTTVTNLMQNQPQRRQHPPQHDHNGPVRDPS